MKTGFVGYASTQNVPNGKITVDLGSMQPVDELVIWNRSPDGMERIIGCELSILNDASVAIKKWAFKDVNDQRAKVDGAPSYLVGFRTKWILTPRWDAAVV